MKKIIFTALCVVFLGAVLLTSQSKPEIYSKTVPIARIYSHALGYKVYYLKTDMKVAYFYLPKSWFIEAGGKGSIIWGNDPAYPYFSIFWIDQQFHHIKLYLQDNLQHESWGALEATESEVRESFNVETLQLEF